MTKELLQQALDALRNSSDFIFKDTDKAYLRDDAIAALESALEQPADSTPNFHAGESNFENWYESGGRWRTGDKQLARDAYAAGMGDPLVTYSQPVQPANPGACIWTDQADNDMPDTYATACGEMWSFIDGGVADNNLNFCHGCGKTVEVATPTEGSQS